VKNLFALSAITLSAIAVIAIVVWGMQSYEKEQAINTSDRSNPHFIDLFMRDFTLTAMNEEGVPNHTLQASYFEHFNDSENARLVNPVIRLLQLDNNWIVSAEKGEIDNDHKQITLYKNVVMTQQGAEFPIQLETSHLEIDTSRQIAKTDKAVHITQKGFDLQSTGMILNTLSGQFELIANVKSTYVQSN
jgi:lipopolysaccharide export system protein LptC